jgi:hypothetical protein
MNTCEHIAKHFHSTFFGGNWTSVSLKESLTGIDWQKATTKVDSLNTIAGLVYHIGYYVAGVTKVLQGENLDASDKFSFDCPPIHSQQDWENLLERIWEQAELFAGLINRVPDSKLDETFVAEKYGSYYRNLHGIIEHSHYHIGQIVIIKKIMEAEKN